MKKVLVINSGSSSIKYQLFDMLNNTVLAKGLLEQIGEPQSKLTHHTRTAGGAWDEILRTQKVTGHQEGFALIGATSRARSATPVSFSASAIGSSTVVKNSANRPLSMPRLWRLSVN